MENNSFSNYLSTKEVSQVLDISYRTLTRYIAQKKLIPQKIKGKNFFNPEDIAHFSAKSEKEIDKIKKQTSYNSHRITELEHRLTTLESLLKIGSPIKYTQEDVNVDALRSALKDMLSKKIWTIKDIENVLSDFSKFSNSLVAHIGSSLCKDVLYRCILQARLSNHERSELMVAKTRVLRYELNLAT